jgi:hypothetical protein
MDSADQTKQTLVYADGYSYTEVFQAPALPDIPGSKKLISVFHAFFTSEDDNASSRERQAAEPQSETRNKAGEII